MKAALTLCWLFIFAAPPAFSQTLKYSAKGWTQRPAASSMRVAEFILPRAVDDKENGEAVIYYFGGQGGGVEENLERWMNQIEQPGGRASREVAKSTSMTVNGLKVTMVDVTGRYVAEVAPGSNERHNKPNYRLIAAVVETPNGPYFLKVTGPRKTIDQWNAAILEFVKSFRFE
jgi:hypothetical protein